MSAVGVLAVIESDANEADFSRRKAGSPYAKALKADSAEARAAVAELIEAVKEYRLSASTTNRQAIARLDAALARVGGA